MLLSIIIPALNEEKYLPILLKSIKKQTVSPFEVIVADAFSKDSTKKVALGFGCIVVSDKGKGPGAGRNAGAKIAKGDLLLFLDADVELPCSTFLEDSIKEMMKKGISVAACYIKPKSTMKTYHLLFDITNQFLRLYQNIYPHAMGYAILAKKELHLKIKGFDETLYLAEDHDYAKRGSKVGKFGLLESHKILVSVRRFRKEGRFKLIIKYIISELHMLLSGPIRKRIYSYKFGEFESVHKYES